MRDYKQRKSRPTLGNSLPVFTLKIDKKHPYLVLLMKLPALLVDEEMVLEKRSLLLITEF